MFKIIKSGDNYIIRKADKPNKYQYFNGYDFMGSVNWVDSKSESQKLDWGSAVATLEDLIKAE